MQADLCNLSKESKTQEVILYTSIVYSIAFISVALRVIGKAVSQRLAWDDAVVVAALLLTGIPLGCVLDMAMKGFGEHLWNLQDNKLLPILRYREFQIACCFNHTNYNKCTSLGLRMLSYSA